MSSKRFHIGQAVDVIRANGTQFGGIITATHARSYTVQNSVNLQEYGATRAELRDASPIF